MDFKESAFKTFKPFISTYHILRRQIEVYSLNLIYLLIFRIDSHESNVQCSHPLNYYSDNNFVRLF